MKKILSLLCIGVLIVCILGGCSKANITDKTETSNNIQKLKNEIVENKEKDLTKELDSNIEDKVYMLNKKYTLSDKDIELMINYLGKIDWEKFDKIQREHELSEFDVEALLKYDKYNSKELLDIYNAYIHSDGVGAENFGVLLYNLHQKYPKISNDLCKTNTQYKKVIDSLIEYEKGMQ